MKCKSEMMPELNCSVLLGVSIFYLLINISPWDWFYQFEIYRYFIDLMSYAVPSIKLLPEETRHGGYEYSVSQLSMLHFFGIVFVLYIVYKTRKAASPLPKSYRKKGVLLNGFVSTFSVGLFFAIFFHYWEGTFNHTIKDGFHDVEWKMTLLYIIFWYLMAAFFGLTSYFFKTLIAHNEYK